MNCWFQNVIFIQNLAEKWPFQIIKCPRKKKYFLIILLNKLYKILQELFFRDKPFDKAFLIIGFCSHLPVFSSLFDRINFKMAATHTNATMEPFVKCSNVSVILSHQLILINVFIFLSLNQFYLFYK